MYYNRSSSVFGNILKGLLGLILVAALVGLVFIGIQLFKSGKAEGIAKDASIAIDNQNPTRGISYWWEYIKNPARMKTYSSEIDDSEEYEDVGVEIVNFESSQTTYFQGNDVRGIAVVEAASLSRNMSNIVFNCSLEDYYGKALVQPADYSYFGNGVKTRKSVGCIFNGSDVNIGSATLNTKTMSFKASFDFVNEAYYNIYVMRKETYENIVYEKQEDPFDYYDVQDDLITVGNVVNSKSTPGPINLGIGTGTSQPFTEGTDPNFLQVSLTPNWNNGNIKYVKDLTLKVTPEIVLENNPNSCDFELYGEELDEQTGEKLYNLYKLTPYAFSEKVNIGCTKEDLNGTGLTSRSCMKDLKSNVQLQCFFSIPVFPEESVQTEGERVNFVLLSPIIARAEYVYELEKKTTVEIRRRESSSSVDACNAYTLEECSTKEGCQVVSEKCVKSS
nr:hypothetical protein [Nanoarchaeum sp.]